MAISQVWFFWVRSFLGVYSPRKQYDVNAPSNKRDAAHGTTLDVIVGSPVKLPPHQIEMSLDELTILYPCEDKG